MLELVLIFCSDMCNFIEALCPDWSDLEQAMASVHTVVHGLVKFSKVGVVSCKLLQHFCSYPFAAGMFIG